LEGVEAAAERLDQRHERIVDLIGEAVEAVEDRLDARRGGGSGDRGRHRGRRRSLGDHRIAGNGHL